MARTVITTDDIDGSANAETIRFSFDGKTYSIDLAKKNRVAFEKALKPYLDVAQKSAGRPAAGGASRRRRPSRRGSGAADLGAVRAWARENGLEVSERGRVAQSVLDAYSSAH